MSEGLVMVPTFGDMAIEYLDWLLGLPICNHEIATWPRGYKAARTRKLNMLYRAFKVEHPDVSDEMVRGFVHRELNIVSYHRQWRTCRLEKLDQFIDPLR